MRRLAILWAGVLAVAVLSSGLARADDLADWRKTRQTAFDAWRAAHPQSGAAAMAVGFAAPSGPLGGLDAAPAIAAAAGPPVEIQDAAETPAFVLVPPGDYTMGAGPNEKNLRGNEPPRKRVRIPQALQVSKYPITVGEFAAFVAETGHDAGNMCWTFEDEDGHIRQGRNWRNPGFTQFMDAPVLCVSWAEVSAYAAWLGRKTGHAYRLLTEAEYEYANRAGTTTSFWWGPEVDSNRADCDGCNSLWDNRRTSPVGAFKPNAFGLYDTTGNTWSWTSDCYLDPKAKPEEGACPEHVIKGGAWHGTPPGMRSFSRFHHTPDTHSATLGFRLVRMP